MRRVGDILGYAVFLILAVIGLSELATRLAFKEQKGYKPHVITADRMPFFVPDDRLGYRLNSGTFNVVQNDSIKWFSTQDEDGNRVTSYSPLPDSLPQVWFLGCSFTYGHAVDDSLVFPFLVQRNLPMYRFRNFGVGGYGTHHALIQLQKIFKEEKTPKHVFIVYSSSHNIRNTGSPIHLKSMSESPLAKGKFTYPYARIVDDSIRIAYTPLNYHGFPLTEYSRLMQVLEQRYDAYRNDQLHSKEVTEKLMLTIRELCEQHGTDMTVVIREKGVNALQMISFMEAVGIPYVDVAVDMSVDGYYVPGDGHPSALTHSIYAEGLIDYIQKMDSIAP